MKTGLKCSLGLVAMVAVLSVAVSFAAAAPVTLQWEAYRAHAYTKVYTYESNDCVTSGQAHARCTYYEYGYDWEVDVGMDVKVEGQLDCNSYDLWVFGHQEFWFVGFPPFEIDVDRWGGLAGQVRVGTSPEYPAGTPINLTAKTDFVPTEFGFGDTWWHAIISGAVGGPVLLADANDQANFTVNAGDAFFIAVAVPEPASISMTLGAIGACLTLLRRRRR